MKSAKQILKELISPTDIEVNGNKPWDIQVHNPKFYSRVLAGGSLALGESYMDGWWDCKDLDQFFFKLLYARLDRKFTMHQLGVLLRSKLFNLQNRKHSKKVAKVHYDLGNDFYKAMLDKNMQYTCAYWKDAKNLNQAQEHKLDLICKKLKLKKGDKVLEIGCGWGGFARYAAKNYGCHVTAYNISKEQVKHAREWCKGLPVEIIHKDYREAKGKFDKIAAIGICEHIGYKNYKPLMKLVNKCLKNHGLFILHTIACDESTTTGEAWLDKYIFPNGMLPSPKQITTAAEGYFVLEDWHNFGINYDKTLMAWYDNFNKNWPKFEKMYGKRFYRMWKYYLLCLAGSFRARNIQLWQIVYSKKGIPDGYDSVR